MKSFEATDISKRFGETIALNNVSFSSEKGEIHGLIGENGAGKSTLIKIIGGVYKPNSGKITILGERVSLHNPWDGVKHSVVCVHQEMSLVPDLTIAENLFIPKPPSNKLKFISQKDIEEKAQDFFNRIGVKSLRPNVTVESLSLRDKQIVEIAKALYRNPKILILDEPTSALGIKDVEWLSNIVKELRNQGISIIYISHRMGEIRGLCDRFTILRNGKNVGTYNANELSDDEVVKLMIGHSIEVIFPNKQEGKNEKKTSIEIKDLYSVSGLKGVNFRLRRGEILGMAALQGQGQHAIFECLFGMERPLKGEILIEGSVAHIKHPRDAYLKGLCFNIGFVPEDRKTEGLFLEMPIRHNVTLPIIDSISKFGFCNRNKELEMILDVFTKMNIDITKLNNTANSLSGGNQQKIVIAKWMLAACKNMLMYDPTRGVDVGTKHEIYTIIREMANSGRAVLFYSSELTELVGLCDRVIAIYGGKVVAEFTGGEITEQKILTAILGINLR
jgi:ribose transport system ATP-binding protein